MQLVGAARRALGIGAISAALLLFEVVLTRIFSVVFWYHFAFAAICLALGGLAASGVWLHHRGGTSPGRAAAAMSLSAGVAVLAALVAGAHLGLPGWVHLPLTWALCALPFFFGGLTIAQLLSRDGEEVSTLYAADLVGAAGGALLAPALLSWVDGPAAALTASALGASASWLLGGGRLAHLALGLSGAALVLQIGAAPLGVSCPKGSCEGELTTQGWNALSRVAVFEPVVGARAGMSPTYDGPPLSTRPMNIDAAAATPIVGWDGREVSLEALRHDVTALTYAVRPPSRVFIAGAGGGPDLLVARAMGARELVAAEINPLVAHFADEEFGEFSGRPYSLPGTRVHLDDARAALRREVGGFDHVTLSLVDTFAAAASGAFALTENHLYTVEAFEDYFDQMAPAGVLAVSRWYRPGRPTEMLRLLSLTRAALEARGVTSPAEHILVAGWLAPEHQSQGAPWGVGLMMASRQPFSAQERALLAARVEAQGFVPLWLGDPSHPGVDPELMRVLSATSLAAFVQAHPDNLRPPTDDWPFFFQAARLRGGLSAGDYLAAGFPLLFLCFFGSLAAALVLVILGRARSGGEDPAAGAPPAVAFGLGVGFILVEIGLLQRFLLLLGQPVRVMALVLPGLLLSAAAGAWLSQRLGEAGAVLTRACAACAVGSLVLAFGLLPVIQALVIQPQPVQIAAALLTVMAIGVPMGMAFPRLLALAAMRHPGSTPWLWAVNGAASVLGSTSAMMIAIFGSYTAVFVAGGLAYGGAALVASALKQPAARVRVALAGPGAAAGISHPT